jgi:hypothetical protein
VSILESADPREAPRPAFLDAPALVRPGWLPEGSGWPVLDEFAAEHRRLLDARRANADARLAASGDTRRRTPPATRR